MHTPTTQDAEHLKLLSVFHFVMAGITGLFSLFPLIHLAMGILILNSPEMMESEAEPEIAMVGMFFVIIPALIIVSGLLLAGLMAAAGILLAKRRRRMFCLVVGGLECLLMPLGTVLGVFTILVLMRESVKASFEAEAT